MVFFEHIEKAPSDPILGLQIAFNTDPRKDKINLSVGVYKTPDLKTPVLNSVKKAEAYLLENEKNKEYLPIDGDKHYVEKVGALVFGPHLWAKISHRTHGSQSVGGTGALRVGGEFLKQEVSEKIYISDPTWPNHKGVFTKCRMIVRTYPYYDKKNQNFNFDYCYAFLKALSPSSIVVLHACCHNPTGCDPTHEQWKQLSDLFLANKLIPFFDCSYQGFGIGLEEDAFAMRLFAKEGHEMLVAVSFAKNFSLYSERAGALFVVTGSDKTELNVASNVKVIIRTLYSNPSIHGAHIVDQILSTPHLREEWEAELGGMRERIGKMRKALTSALMARSKGKDFRFLDRSVGLFSFCGLEKTQVEKLISEYGIYMTSDGRINVAGLNDDNLNKVADAIIAVTR